MPIRHLQPTRTLFALLLGTAGLISAGLTPVYSQSATDKEPSMAFKFENYATEEAARNQLEQLFPVGSELDRFSALMSDLGAKCYEQPKPSQPVRQLFCHYLEPGSFVRTKWIVGVDVDADQKIAALSVKRGFTGT